MILKFQYSLRCIVILTDSFVTDLFSTQIHHKTRISPSFTSPLSMKASTKFVNPNRTIIQREFETKLVAFQKESQKQFFFELKRNHRNSHFHQILGKLHNLIKFCKCSYSLVIRIRYSCTIFVCVFMFFTERVSIFAVPGNENHFRIKIKNYELLNYVW